MLSIFRILVALLSLSLLCNRTYSVPPSAPEALKAVAPREIEFDKFLGVNAHLLWFPEPIYKKQLDQLEGLGLSWLRLDLHWSYLEPEFNQLQYVKELDQLMTELNRRQAHEVVYLVGSPRFVSTAKPGDPQYDKYPPSENPLALPGLGQASGIDLFAARMKELTTRYPNVDAWEIWNEPNIPSSWAPKEDPIAYGKLAMKTAALLPSDRLKVLGGMAYFSEMPMRSGEPMLKVLLDYQVQNIVDVVSYHPYTNLPDGAGEFDLKEKVALYNGYMRQHGVKQIWATEFGWSTYPGPVEYQPLITQQQQADYLLKRIALMMETDFERIFLFALADLDERASVRDRYYGLLDRNGDPKPSYSALKSFLTTLGPKVTFINIGAVGNGVEHLAWWQGDKRQVALFWGKSGTQVKISAPQTAARATLVDPMQRTSQSVALTGNQYTVTMNGQLQMLVLE